METVELSPGKYAVTLQLATFLNQTELQSFERQFREIENRDNDFGEICQLVDGVLRYQSETLLPHLVDNSKERILMVFGNPAVHSVKNGMFYFSRADHSRHSMWGKLDLAGLVRLIKSKDTVNSLAARIEEADIRRDLLIKGTSSDRYLVGLTTFYSFPTPVENGFPYSNVAGVKRLFSAMLLTLNKLESERILSYSFSKGATLIFAQKSSYEAFCKVTGTGHKTIYWPIRGAGSSGSNLRKLLGNCVRESV